MLVLLIAGVERSDAGAVATHHKWDRIATRNYHRCRLAVHLSTCRVLKPQADTASHLDQGQIFNVASCDAQRGERRMRGLLFGMVLAMAVGAARADPAPTPSPSDLEKLAEKAVSDTLTDPDSAKFRAEGVAASAWLKHGAFGRRIDGPAWVVCGQFNSKNRMGGYNGYAWFFVAMKDGAVLWADIDDATDDQPGPAYYGCHGVGLAA